MSKAAALFIPLALSLGWIDSESTEDPPPVVEDAAGHQDREAQLVEAVSAERLRDYHTLVASEPHRAGTDGDLAQVVRLAETFEAMGLEVELHEFWAYLCEPIEASLAIVSPIERGLSLRETPLDEDPHSLREGLTFGWNAFSGSGEVRAEVVYANRGTLEDFAKLKEMGVDCTGKIVVCRYGGNFRGYKAKFAEEAGAAGLIIYTDPGDSGFTRGLMYPKGGFANPTTIQRGSIITLPYDGDPLTPDVCATFEAERLDPDEIDLPRIPVQPVGWGTAREILGRMEGREVPEGWQGGLPFRYRVEGGSELVVDLRVEQRRGLVRTFNVIGTLEGAKRPEEMVLLGAHHDAWEYGAADPTCGLITVLETARILSQEAKAGRRPDRSIVFCAWGAEEFGVVGSVEWVESRTEELFENAVCYLNLDMASMGLNFRSSAAPSLRRTIEELTHHIPQPGAPEGVSVHDVWTQGRGDRGPAFGELGGGSDHVGFVAVCGVPCASFGGSGAPGASYHSMYDTLTWYRRFVAGDYESARMVARAALLFTDRMANAPIHPMDLAGYPRAIRGHLRSLEERGNELDFFAVDADGGRLAPSIAVPEAKAFEVEAVALRVEKILERGEFDDEQRRLIDRHLRLLDRAWIFPPGLPERPWFRNLYAAPDETSGYASWVLPGIRKGIEDRDRELTQEMSQVLTAALTLYQVNLETLIGQLED